MAATPAIRSLPWVAGLCFSIMAGGCGPAATLKSGGSDRSAEGTPAAATKPVAAAKDGGFVGEGAAPFELVERSGEKFDSTVLLGKVWMASVFFANCPGTCYRENQSVAEILRRIPDPDFVAVSVSCDPENDTPEALGRYAERFDAPLDRWKFLTGEMDTIKKIANGTFLLPAEVGVHSERGVVFDRRGRLRGSYHLLQPDRVKLLEQLVRDLLAEPAEGAAVLPAELAPAPAAGAVVAPAGSGGR